MSTDSVKEKSMIRNKRVTASNLALALGVFLWSAIFARAADINQPPTVVVSQDTGQFGASPLPAVVTVAGSPGYGLATLPAGLSNVAQVSTAGNYALALKNDGTVVAWGDDAHGVVTDCNVNKAAQLTNIIAIKADATYALALKGDGTVIFLATSAGDYGTHTVMNGLISATNTATLGGGSPVVAVQPYGDYFAACIKANGTMSVWYYDERITPGAVNAEFAGYTDVLDYKDPAILKRDGTVVFRPNNAGFVTYMGLVDAANIRAIATKTNTVLALKHDNTVIGWNNSGAASYVVPAALAGGDMASIGAASNSFYAIKNDGTVINEAGASLFTGGVVAEGAGLDGVDMAITRLNTIKVKVGQSYTFGLGNITPGLGEGLAQTVPQGNIVVTRTGTAITAPAQTGYAALAGGSNAAYASYSYTAGSAVGSSTVTVTVTDDATPPKTTTRAFVVDVVDVNTAPVIDPALEGSNITVAETALGYSAPIAPNSTVGSNPNDALSGQTLSYTVTNNNNPVFFTQPAISPSGTLTFKPNHSISAQTVVTVTVVLKDNGGVLFGGVDTAAAKTFTITLTPSIPAFTQGANIEASSSVTLNTFAGWASAIVAGAADDAGARTSSFSCSLSNNAGLYFLVPPAINSANGNLTFTPASINTSDVVVTVNAQLINSAGAPYSGADYSAQHTFTITLKAGLIPAGPLANGGKIDSGSVSADMVLVSDGLGGSNWKNVADINISGDLEGGLTATNELKIKAGTITADKLAPGVLAGATGVAGPQGPPGATGPQGPAGSSGSTPPSADFPQGTLIKALSTQPAPSGWTAIGTETIRVKNEQTKKMVKATVVTYVKD
jgi:hypothetical protein